MKHIHTFSSFLTESSTSGYEIVTGKEFKQRYLSTESGELEKVYFQNEEGGVQWEPVSMGAVLGYGEYFSVSLDSSEHYTNDDYYASTGYYVLDDKAKIMLIPNAQEIGGVKIMDIAMRNRVDGVYDPTEGAEPEMAYLGLAIYNPKVIK